MIANCENVENLRRLVNGHKMQFIIKIYHLLTYSLYHENDINFIGIYWADCDGLLSVNSAILGDFVGIKSNSVNKNLKSYGLIKEKNPKSNIFNVKSLVDRSRWIYRKSSIYTFNSGTPIEEVRAFKPRFNVSSPGLPLPSSAICKNELNNNLKIPSISLLKNRNTDWESAFKSKFEQHWLDIAESNNTVKIKTILHFLKIDHSEKFLLDPQIENKILAALSFFSNDNGEIIDIDDYFVFCSFFGFDEAIIQNIENLPFDNDGVPFVCEANLQNSWFKMVKFDQPLLSLIENHLTDTWILCFSNEPGIYLLLNKKANCILQTQIFFDALDNSYCIGTSAEGIKKFISLNDLIFFYLKLDLQNLLNINLNSLLVSLPADFLQFNMN